MNLAEIIAAQANPAARANAEIERQNRQAGILPDAERQGGIARRFGCKTNSDLFAMNEFVRQQLEDDESIESTEPIGSKPISRGK